MKAEAAAFTLPKLPEQGQGHGLCGAAFADGRPGAVSTCLWATRKPGSEMGHTRASEFIHFNLPPGNHTILVQS